jgi:D-glycero-D-manno-heptose 1,7-bisphosphate phosphatase
MNMNRAVFLDRDGTINVEVGYLSDLSRLRLIPGAGAAIKRLNDAGLKVVLITNQSGVARGYFPESFVLDTHALLEKMLQEQGARLDGVYYCPHHPKAGTTRYTMTCDCRKPGTGLIDRAARDLTLDVKGSFMVGDKWSDIELGKAGARPCWSGPVMRPMTPVMSGRRRYASRTSRRIRSPKRLTGSSNRRERTRDEIAGREDTGDAVPLHR